MKKLVIQTQYKENYAAWDWDGQGECPQGWKFKGGTTYVMPNCAEDIDVDSVVEAISSHITVSNDHTAEYIISADVVEVAPAYDHAEVTSLAAATIVFELTNLFAKK